MLARAAAMRWSAVKKVRALAPFAMDALVIAGVLWSVLGDLGDLTQNAEVALAAARLIHHACPARSAPRILRAAALASGMSPWIAARDGAAAKAAIRRLSEVPMFFSGH